MENVYAYVTYLIGFNTKEELDKFIEEKKVEWFIIGDVYEDMDEYPYTLELREEIKVPANKFDY